MKKVTWSAGHALTTNGKQAPNGQKEWTFNAKVVKAGMDFLSGYDNVEQLRLDDPTGKIDIPLRERSNRANNWGTNLHVDVHHNVIGNIWRDSETGIETYAMVGTKYYSESLQIAKKVHPNIIEAMRLKDRGIKSQNLHMLRELNAPAILTEGGFMDSRVDYAVISNDLKLKAQGEAIALGIADYLNLERKVAPIEEGIRMYKPSTKTLEKEMVDLLTQAVDEGILSSPEWVAKAKEGKLPLDDAVGLLATIIHRDWMRQ